MTFLNIENYIKVTQVIINSALSFCNYIKARKRAGNRKDESQRSFTLFSLCVTECASQVSFIDTSNSNGAAGTCTDGLRLTGSVLTV